jgi:hypothetical protein
MKQKKSKPKAVQKKSSAFETAMKKIANTPKEKVERAIERDKLKKIK